MVNTETKVRKATKKDIPQLVELWKKFIKHHQRLSPKTRFYMSMVKNADRKWVRYVKAKKLGKRNAMMFVAVKGKKLIGYATGNLEKNKPVYKLKSYGVFGSFFVVPEQRGKGVGNLLRHAVFEWFKSKKLKHVEIVVMVGNKKTKKIYEHWGFKDYEIKMRRKL